VCGLEVVLATGECIHTGFGRFGAGPLAPLHRWGVGPTLDGLFSQSSLGVVTQMTVWLSARPRSLAAARFRIVDSGRLAAMVDALRALRMEGTLRAGVGIWNDYRMLSTRGGYPWGECGGRTPLGRDVLDRLAAEWGGARWFGLTGLYAPTEEQGAAQRDRVQRILGPCVDDLEFAPASADPPERARLDDDDPALLFLQGIPHERSLQSVYWRKKETPVSGLDPDRDRCGVLWLCPTVPLSGRDVAAAAAIAEALMPAHGFDPLLAVVAPTERTAYVLPLLTYDRDVSGEDERAMSCHDALLDAYCRRGYLPNRLGVQSMGRLPPPDDDSAEVLWRVKQALDPGGVLAPGRYESSRTATSSASPNRSK
jgi:FAD/FMN-containing dehydrogenase